MAQELEMVVGMESVLVIDMDMDMDVVVGIGGCSRCGLTGDSEWIGGRISWRVWSMAALPLALQYFILSFLADRIMPEKHAGELERLRVSCTQTDKRREQTDM